MKEKVGEAEAHSKEYAKECMTVEGATRTAIPPRWLHWMVEHMNENREEKMFRYMQRKANEEVRMPKKRKEQQKTDSEKETKLCPGFASTATLPVSTPFDGFSSQP